MAEDTSLHCPQCGYDLRAIVAGRCPECGFAYDHEALRAYVREETDRQIGSFESWGHRAMYAGVSFVIVLLPDLWRMMIIPFAFVACFFIMLRHVTRPTNPPPVAWVALPWLIGVGLAVAAANPGWIWGIGCIFLAWAVVGCLVHPRMPPSDEGSCALVVNADLARERIRAWGALTLGVLLAGFSYFRL